MYLLSCVEGYQFPRPGDVYILEMVSVAAGLASISSKQELALCNPLRLSQGPVRALQTPHGNITSLAVYDAAASVVCTAGENGTLSVWDLRTDEALVQTIRASSSGSEVSITSLACAGASNSIAAGTELKDHQASILVWDIRANQAPRTQYNEVHSDDITEIKFHPGDPGIILSGSTDGLVNVCDTRIADEDEVVIQTFNHGASIHHAGFLNNTEVFALSHDEKFTLYDMAETQEKGVATADFGDAREALGCQYVANVFPKQNGTGAVIGAGSQDQEMFTLVHMSKGERTWTLDRESAVGLPGAHGGEIVRSFQFFDEEQVVFTAGEDGKIKAWKPST